MAQKLLRRKKRCCFYANSMCIPLYCNDSSMVVALYLFCGLKCLYVLSSFFSRFHISRHSCNIMPKGHIHTPVHTHVS